VNFASVDIYVKNSIWVLFIYYFDVRKSDKLTSTIDTLLVNQPNWGRRSFTMKAFVAVFAALLLFHNFQGI
jgi:hypothetical protein